MIDSSICKFNREASLIKAARGRDWYKIEGVDMEGFIFATQEIDFQRVV